MQTTYCSNCATAHPWEITKPKTCKKCSQPLEAPIALATARPAPAPVPRFAAPVRPQAPANRFQRNRPSLRDMAASAPEQIDASQDDQNLEEEGDDYFDKNEARAHGAELAQGLSADDFVVGGASGDYRSFKWSDLVREGQQNQPAPVTEKASRARKPRK